MKNIKIIKPYTKRPLSMATLEGSLYKDGLSRAPATSLMVEIPRDAKGTILTGIDENTMRIQAISDSKARKLEQERVKAIREDLQRRTNQDLTPDSGFWKEKAEEFYHLRDGDNVFDMNDPYQAIDFYWLTQLPIVAKSIDDIKSGRIKDDTVIKFYVYESDVEVENEFNRKKKINDVVSTLNKLTEAGLRKVAFILNLKMPDKSTYNEIYNQVDEFIKTPKAYGTSDPVEEFVRATSYTDEVLAIKVLIKQLLEERILKTRGASVFEGENLIAKSIEDFEIALAGDAEMFESYSAKYAGKKDFVNSI